jgi:hypothetical protein
MTEETSSCGPLKNLAGTLPYHRAARPTVFALCAIREHRKHSWEGCCHQIPLWSGSEKLNDEERAWSVPQEGRRGAVGFMTCMERSKRQNIHNHASYDEKKKLDRWLPEACAVRAGDTQQR